MNQKRSSFAGMASCLNSSPESISYRQYVDTVAEPYDFSTEATGQPMGSFLYLDNEAFSTIQNPQLQGNSSQSKSRQRNANRPAISSSFENTLGRITFIAEAPTNMWNEQTILRTVNVRLSMDLYDTYSSRRRLGKSRHNAMPKGAYNE